MRKRFGVIAATGHGFRFAPVIGQRFADMAGQGRSDLSIGFLGVERFKR
jgi:glycine/D-amino acid oxidase-like deaminating enzyme